MRLRPGVFLAALVCAAEAGAAQTNAGPFIPAGSHVEHLVTRVIDDGGFDAIDPLTRPYRLAAVRRAALSQDTLFLSPVGRGHLARLHSALDLLADSTHVTAEVGLSSYRNGRRDAFRQGGGAGTSPAGGIWASVSRGPVVGVLNPAFDNRLKNDPQFTGKVDRFIAGRLQNAYLALTGEAGDLVLGRMGRQWGPDLFEGLQLSTAAYPADMLAGTLRFGRFTLTTLAQRLDDQDSAGVAPIQRWFLGHRLSIRAGRRIWLAFTETGVYGGPGRGFEPAFHAPLNSALLSVFNEHLGANLFWGVEAHVPIRRGVLVSGQLMIDDLHIDDSALADQRPFAGGGSVQLRFSPSHVSLQATLGYTRVQSLTYRNSFAPYEVYAHRGVGLARNRSDYDQLLVRLRASAGERADITLESSYLRQGSGDFRQPFPPDSVLAGPGQGFLVAPVGRAAAVLVTLEARPARGVQLRLTMGVDGNPEGPTRSIGSVTASVRYDILRRRLSGAWRALELP